MEKSELIEAIVMMHHYSKDVMEKEYDIAVEFRDWWSCEEIIWLRGVYKRAMEEWINEEPTPTK